MDMLSHLPTVGEIKEVLKVLESGEVGLDDRYNAAIERIRGQNTNARDRAVKILSWVSHAERSLTVKELLYALAVKEGAADFDEDYLLAEEHLLPVCAGLIRIDQEGGTVRWIHETARVYFEKNRGTLFPDAQRHISSVCITYLSFSSFESGPCKTPEEFQERLNDAPLFRYAATSWALHLSSDMVASQLLSTFLNKSSAVTASGQCLFAEKPNEYAGYALQNSFGTTAVHLAAYFGLFEVVEERLLRCHDDADKKDSAGRTPLFHAARNGYSAIVELLLANGADPDMDAKRSDSDAWRTPLSFAAENGHEEVVRLLLERGADPGSTGRRYTYYQTPLMLASEKGHLGIVQKLLQKGAKVEARPTENMTALSYAAQTGHVDITRALLDKGASVDANWVKNDHRFRTPLSYAAEGGHTSVVQLLLERGARAGTYDIFDRTPLSYAGQNGTPEVIDLLLDVGGAKVNAYEYNGEAPISHAAARGDFRLVKLLLDRGADPNRFCIYDENDMGSPLLDAVRGGHTAVVKLLIDTGEVWTDPTEQWEGTSALCCAADRGYKEIVMLILQSANVHLNHRTHRGRTPLSFAAGSGHHSIVEILLGTEGIEVDSRDWKDRTPLSHAAYGGHDSIVRLLLGRADVDAENRDFRGQTPLYSAFKAKHTNVVRVLLTESGGRANPESTDKDGLTLFAQAARDGNLPAAKFLLSLEVVNPDSKDNEGRTPFLHAAANGHMDLVKLLLLEVEPRIDVNVVDRNGASAVLYAAKQAPDYLTKIEGHDEALRVLLETCDASLFDLPDAKGRTPLSYAAESGRILAATTLLAAQPVDPIRQDLEGRGPLSYAAENGTVEVVRAILSQKSVDINSKDNDGRTALWWFVHGESTKESQRYSIPMPSDASHTSKTQHESTSRYPAMELLLQHPDIDVNAATLSTAQTTLMLAVEKGLDKLLKVFLRDKRVDPNARTTDGRTALHMAVDVHSWHCVVSLLQDIRVRLDSCSSSQQGWTPLWWAARIGDAEVTRLCLEKPDVDPNLRDENGRTPLSLAAQAYHKEFAYEDEKDKSGVVALLLGHPKLQPNIKDKEGKTPLWWATQGYGKFQKEVVELLAANERVDPCAMPGWNPLGWAARRGVEKVVRAVLNRPDVDPDLRDEDGRTPLSRAAESGWEAGVVEALLNTGRVDPDSRDDEGFSPLFRAIGELTAGFSSKGNGLARIIKLLLSRQAVSLKFKGEAAWKPKDRYLSTHNPILVWAVQNGDADIVRLMLQKKEADPNEEDEDGRSPLWHAAQEKKEEVVKVLLETEGFEIDKKDREAGRTPFSCAVGNLAIMRMLFETRRVDVNARDNNGMTALSHAVQFSYSAEEGQVDIVEFLLGMAGAEPDVKDGSGRTPLSHAAKNRHQGVIDKLLKTEGVDPNSRDNEGMTPLAHAAAGGSTYGVESLLADERVDFRLVDNKGLSVLDHAKKNYGRSWNVKIREKMGLEGSTCSSSSSSGGGYNSADEAELDESAEDSSDKSDEEEEV